jgi:hypothetical protein
MAFSVFLVCLAVYASYLCTDDPGSGSAHSGMVVIALVVGVLLAKIVAWGYRCTQAERFFYLPGLFAATTLVLAGLAGFCYYGVSPSGGFFCVPKCGSPYQGLGSHLYFSVMVGSAIGLGDLHPAGGLPRYLVAVHAGLQLTLIGLAAWIALQRDDGAGRDLPDRTDDEPGNVNRRRRGKPKHVTS